MYLLFVLICTIAIQTFKRTLCAMLRSTQYTRHSIHIAQFKKLLSAYNWF